MVMEQLRQAEISLASRMQALVTYGFLGITAGLFMTFTGAPATMEAYYGTWVRLVFGSLAVLGGVLIQVGARIGSMTRPGWKTCFAGTAVLWLWLAAMFGAYLFAATDAGIVLTWPWEPIPPTASRPFLPALFLTLAMLLSMHLTVLWKIRPPRR